MKFKKLFAIPSIQKVDEIYGATFYISCLTAASLNSLYYSTYQSLLFLHVKLLYDFSLIVIIEIHITDYIFFVEIPFIIAPKTTSENYENSYTDLKISKLFYRSIFHMNHFFHSCNFLKIDISRQSIYVILSAIMFFTSYQSETVFFVPFDPMTFENNQLSQNVAQ